MSLIDYLPLVISLVVVSTVSLVIAQMGAHGSLARNGLVGIRIAATMQSDVAWYAAHKAIAPAMRACAWVQLSGAATVLGFGLTTQNSAVIPVGLAFLILPAIATVVAAMTVGKSAANEAHRAWEKEQQAAQTHN